MSAYLPTYKPRLQCVQTIEQSEWLYLRRPLSASVTVLKVHTALAIHKTTLMFIHD